MKFNKSHFLILPCSHMTRLQWMTCMKRNCSRRFWTDSSRGGELPPKIDTDGNRQLVAALALMPERSFSGRKSCISAYSWRSWLRIQMAPSLVSGWGRIYTEEPWHAEPEGREWHKKHTQSLAPTFSWELHSEGRLSLTQDLKTSHLACLPEAIIGLHP